MFCLFIFYLLVLYFFKFLSCLYCLAKCVLWKKVNEHRRWPKYKKTNLPKLKEQLTKISEREIIMKMIKIWVPQKIRMFFLHLKQNWKKVWSQRLQSLWSINTIYTIHYWTPSTFFKIRVMYLELSRQNTKSIYPTLILYMSVNPRISSSSSCTVCWGWMLLQKRVRWKTLQIQKI